MGIQSLELNPGKDTILGLFMLSIRTIEWNWAVESGFTGFVLEILSTKSGTPLRASP